MASSSSLLKNILNLKCMHVFSEELISSESQFNKSTYFKTELHVHARPFKRMQQKCPVCQKRCSIYDHKQKEESRWRAPNLNGIPVYILYQPVRIQCPEHGILTEYIPWADGESRFTADFNNEIAWMVCQTSRSAIATYFDINWRTTGNCVKAAHNRIEPDLSARLHGLKRICVDETSSSKGHKYITVVYDMDRNRVVWIHEDHGTSVFSKFCDLLSEEERAAIEIVAGDGARWIDTCVEKYFPNAERCVDPFHVVGWANEALDKVRSAAVSKALEDYNKLRKEYILAEREEKASREAMTRAREEAMAELESLPKRGRPSRKKKELLAFLAECQETQDESPKPEKQPAPGRPRKEQFSPEHQKILDERKLAARNIKGAKYALGHDPKKCSAAQTDKLRLIENSNPELYRAYQLKEALRLILHMQDYKAAAMELDRWTTEAKSSKIQPMGELADKILRHKQNIINTIRFGANSAKSEATNTTIKVLIKMAHGFRNLDNLKALIYLKCSDLVVPLNNRMQLSSEQAATKRLAANQKRKERESRKSIGME